MKYLPLKIALLIIVIGFNNYFFIPPKLEPKTKGDIIDTVWEKNGYKLYINIPIDNDTD